MNLYIAGFNKGALIGHGAFGHVHKCDDPVHGVVAGKFIFANKFPDPNAWHAAKSQALNEAKNLSALEHPNTVRVFQCLLILRILSF
ncbi:hypothetical protein [Shimia thalassica]|uniref:hypothetical protein n=1 Tax=Shimia thalassica TaxID=1715693 RepID=UPI00273539A1|nr:hypothetical protein [Shimia thalassica]MDP2520906.1 hypothetical protein [Shimia thalassica]